jgi:hypothetical protein
VNGETGQILLWTVTDICTKENIRRHLFDPLYVIFLSYDPAQFVSLSAVSKLLHNHNVLNERGFAVVD